MPGAIDVMALGFATNAVTVNGQAAYRKGEYFRAEVHASVLTIDTSGGG